MKLMNLTCVAVCGVIVLCSGCDWTSGGGTNTWNDRYNWVNFSGVYRGINNGILVTDFTPVSTTGGGVQDGSQSLGTADGTRTDFAGTLSHRPIIEGSLKITVAGYTFTDDGSGILSSGRSDASGTIEHGTGAWTLSFGIAPSAGQAVNATYSYNTASDITGGGSGASKITIYSFTVFQQGNTLSITDNNGSVYEGNMGSISSTGGASQDNTIVPAAGDQVIGQFTASGVSAAGIPVEMAGTLQGVVAGGGDSGIMLSQRQMFGTWIEDNGTTGDINGTAAPIGITIDTTTDTTTTTTE